MALATPIHRAMVLRISSIPLPADAALMTGGLEWRGACRHLRPRQIRTGIGSTAEPDSRLGLGASTSTRDVGMPFAVMCPFPTSTFSLVNINALGVQSTRPPLIHRAPHTSHSGFHVYCMAQALGERRQVVQGDRAECDGVKRHRLPPSMVLANRFQGSGTAPFSTRSPPRWPAACIHGFPCNAPHYGNTNRQDGCTPPAMPVQEFAPHLPARRVDRCRLRLGWETIAARRKGRRLS